MKIFNLQFFLFTIIVYIIAIFCGFIPLWDEFSMYFERMLNSEMKWNISLLGGYILWAIWYLFLVQLILIGIRFLFIKFEES